MVRLDAGGTHQGRSRRHDTCRYAWKLSGTSTGAGGEAGNGCQYERIRAGDGASLQCCVDGILRRCGWCCDEPRQGRGIYITDQEKLKATTSLKTVQRLYG